MKMDKKTLLDTIEDLEDRLQEKHREMFDTITDENLMDPDTEEQIAIQKEIFAISEDLYEASRKLDQIVRREKLLKDD